METGENRPDFPPSSGVLPCVELNQLSSDIFTRNMICPAGYRFSNLIKTVRPGLLYHLADARHVTRCRRQRYRVVCNARPGLLGVSRVFRSLRLLGSVDRSITDADSVNIHHSSWISFLGAWAGSFPGLCIGCIPP
jgi:hypothetical protein